MFLPSSFFNLRVIMLALFSAFLLFAFSILENSSYYLISDYRASCVVTGSEGFWPHGGVIVQVVVHGVHVFARRLHFGHFTATDHESFAEGEGGTSELRVLCLTLDAIFERAILEGRAVGMATTLLLLLCLGMRGLEKDLSHGQLGKS